MPTLVAPDPPNQVEILGIPVARIDMDQAMAILDHFIEEGSPHLVVTADSCGLAQSTEDAEFRSILLKADLITPDSAGVLWAAKRLGKPIRERVSGVDLLARLCERSAERGWRIFLLGAAPGVADLAAAKLTERNPGCRVVGTRDGFFPQEDDEAVALTIAETRPDVLVVAMGIPRQEKFIAKTLSIIRAPISIGVGGSLDVFSGRAKRAPKIFQRLKLEWLWRLILKPSKISKAKYLPRFVRLVWKEAP